MSQHDLHCLQQLVITSVSCPCLDATPKHKDRSPQTWCNVLHALECLACTRLRALAIYRAQLVQQQVRLAHVSVAIVAFEAHQVKGHKSGKWTNKKPYVTLKLWMHATAQLNTSYHILITSHHTTPPHHVTAHHITSHCIASHRMKANHITSHQIKSHHTIALHRIASQL